MTKMSLQKEEYGKIYQGKSAPSLLYAPVNGLHQSDLPLFSFLNQAENMKKPPPHVTFARNQNRSCGSSSKND